MPLTMHQRRVAKLLASNRTPDSYLAGGAALHLAPNSTRYSKDLDFFHDSEERVASAFAEDRRLLEKSDFEVDVTMAQPGYVRATVSKEDESTQVEWAHDSAWRFVPPIRDDTAGYLLHPVDLAVNKLLAVVGRDEIRDFVDLLEIHGHTLSIGVLCWAAAGKDPGFTPSSLLEMLRRRGRYQPRDLARLRVSKPLRLDELKAKWLEALNDAERFIANRPADEMGCLYWSSSEEAFVNDPTGSSVVPHFGRPGGVIPAVS